VKIVSWNVNGLRAVTRKGFGAFVDACGADVIGIQETRCRPDEVPEELRSRSDWHVRWTCAERPGYSGVGLLSRHRIDEVRSSLGQRTFDREGRVQMARIGRLTVVNAYFPNGNGKDRDLSRVPYKLRFYRRLHRTLEPALRAGERIVVIGDFNTAPEEIDLARPRENRAHTGFLPEERREIARWKRSGWIDTFRAFEKNGGHYTWWSQRIGVREKNIGWRLDLALASPSAMEHVRGASIHPDVRGSDHCPISLELDDSVA
jgi:exodeoxyribonuclease-3